MSRLRALELTALQRLLNLRGFNLAILFTWPTLVSLLTFAVFVLIGEQLTVPKTFSVLVRAAMYLHEFYLCVIMVVRTNAKCPSVSKLMTSFFLEIYASAFTGVLGHHAQSSLDASILFQRCTFFFEMFALGISLNPQDET